MDPWLAEEGIKVALAYKDEQKSTRIAKVWRFPSYTQMLDSYNLATVKEEFLEYFPEIAARHFTLKLHYRDSFVGMISIDTDKDLKVRSYIMLFMHAIAGYSYTSCMKLHLKMKHEATLHFMHAIAGHAV